MATDTAVIRQIAQNVTEHFQEDEKDSFLLAYAIVALVICLILSFDLRKWIEEQGVYFESDFVVSVRGAVYGHRLLPPKVYRVQALVEV